MAEAERQSLTDAEIFRSVGETIENVLLPALPDDAEWARTAAIQLVGLVRYAARRQADRTIERIDELADVLASLGTNELVGWSGERTQVAVMEAVGAALARAAATDGVASDEIRRILRPVVVRHLDDELAETGPLVDAFRGRLDG